MTLPFSSALPNPFNTVSFLYQLAVWNGVSQERALQFLRQNIVSTGTVDAQVIVMLCREVLKQRSHECEGTQSTFGPRNNGLIECLNILMLHAI